MAKPFYRRYSLSIVLAALFLLCWIGQTAVGWFEFSDEQKTHGELAQWLGDGGYLRSWGRATLENWQSEFLQLFAFVVLSAVLHHEGSPEARDSEEETERMLTKIDQRIARLERTLERE
jgi:hypothetical protein